MSRDREATRAAILAAAEDAFAQRGYDGTSLQQIAAAAGVSRGMPNYAFGSKSALYQAVLDRAFAAPQAMIAEFSALAGQDLTQALAALVDRYVDYLAGRPAYVRLLQRAALDGDGRLGAAAGNTSSAAAAMAAVSGIAGERRGPAADPGQLIISVVALCFFPFAHQSTLLGPLGLDAHAPQFLAGRKAHVTDLLLHGLTGGAALGRPPDGG
jgi:TetR/AcrR family transcriptional regulator